MDVKDVEVLFDGGHGINTQGKGSPFSLKGVAPELPFREWKFNREIANKCVESLKALGYNAKNIVPEDIDISLSERVRRVNAEVSKYGKDKVIFISIHANAAGNGRQWMNATGWGCYTTKGVTESDTLAKYLYAQAEKCFAGRTIRKHSKAEPDFEENFTVLFGTRCPAVLTENFFQDNIEDVQYLNSEEGKEAIIKCHVNAVIEFLKNRKSK